MDEIIDLRTEETRVSKEDAFVTLISGAKRQKEITKGSYVLVQCKDVCNTWNDLKYVKESYPVQLDEYAIDNGYSNEPFFAWWVNF